MMKESTSDKKFSAPIHYQLERPRLLLKGIDMSPTKQFFFIGDVFINKTYYTIVNRTVYVSRV